MPFVFPKRFLRTRDILDPLDMNKDDGPVMDLIEGKLDRHNFFGPGLKTKEFASTPFGAAGTPAVDYDAYQSLRYTSVECPVRFHHAKSNDGTGRKPPNFVELDGSTFRHTISSPSNDDGYPSIGFAQTFSTYGRAFTSIKVLGRYLRKTYLVVHP